MRPSALACHAYESEYHEQGDTLKYRVIGIHLQDDAHDMYGKWTTEKRARKKAAWWVANRLQFSRYSLRSILIEDETGKREVIAQ